MKIALVYSGAKPKWVSAQFIRENLRSAWTGIEGLRITEFPYSKNQNWPAWSRAIRTAKPDIIVFLESLPVPVKAVRTLSRSKTLKDTPFIFHIYGDFSIQTYKWFYLGQFLKNRPVLWLAASAAQHGQLTQFLNSGSGVRCLPFPVDSEQYHPFGLREEISGRGHRFLYAGRFTTQKNSMLLLEWASEYLQKNANARFDFAGPFDDFGAELWGIKESPNSNQNNWNKLLESLPEFVRKRIQYHGNLASAELRTLSSQCDCYVSLSTHHDEDFGMAPLESLLCGTRAVLSGWGGFSSFAFDSDSVEIIPVGIKKDSLSLKKSHFFKALDNITNKPRVSNDERCLRHLIFSSHFGIAATSEKLKAILQTSFNAFTGFNFFMQLHGSLILQYWLKGSTVYKAPGKSDPIYERVYRSYRKPNLKI